MAADSARKLTKLPPSLALEREFEDHPISRDVLVREMQLWDQAIAAREPDAPTPNRDTTVYRFDTVFTAPMIASENPQPVSQTTTDGLMPAAAEALKEELDSWVEAQTIAPVETELAFDNMAQPVRRTYVFDRPVTVASSGGYLYTVDSDGTKIPLGRDVPARVVIEETWDVAPGSPVYKTLTGALRDAVVTWTAP